MVMHVTYSASLNDGIQQFPNSVKLTPIGDGLTPTSRPTNVIFVFFGLEYRAK